MMKLGAAHIVSMACGLLMVAEVGIGSHGPALVAAITALVAVAVGALVRPLATVAVLLAVGAIVTSDPAAAVAAAAGLSAAFYLVLRHAAASGTGLGTVSGPTMIAAVAFAFAGLAATAFPVQLPWLPLLAPLAVLAIYLLAARPFFHDENL